MSKNFDQEIDSIISQLQPIRLEVLQAEQHFREELDHVHLANLQSARNLVHYMSLRRHDIRELQQDLGRLALSSLGRLESHVIATLDALLALLCKIAIPALLLLNAKRVFEFFTATIRCDTRTRPSRRRAARPRRRLYDIRKPKIESDVSFVASSKFLRIPQF